MEYAGRMSRARAQPSAADALAAALAYLRRGWPVVPARPRDKTPLVRWEELQRRRPTAAEVARTVASITRLHAADDGDPR